jgi:hypothetical protein
MKVRFSLLLALAGLLLNLTSPAQAQKRAGKAPARPPKTVVAEPLSFYNTYAYRSYTIFSSEEPEPIVSDGVGGTLTLQPQGSYQKRLRLAGPEGPMEFRQDGQFTLSGDQISFSYTDSQGKPKTDRGAFRFDPQTGALTVTIEAYPAGSRGVYTLEAQRSAAR